jgi:hypothetical protein
MTRQMKKTAGSAIALAAASALLAGCFSVEATFTIKDDATADIDYVILIDTEQLEEFSGLLGEDAGAVDDLSGDALLEETLGGDDPCADLGAGLSEFDVSVRDIDENGKVGVGCTVSGVPIAELTSLGDGASSFSIEQDAGVTRFNAVLEGVDELAGDPAETDAMTEMLGVNLDELITIKFTVSAPGSLGENNASSTSGSSATWDVKADSDFVTDGDATMTAQWNPGGGGGGGSSTWNIVAIIAAVVAAAAIAFVLFKRSKGAPDELAAPAANGVPMTPPGFTPDTAGATPPPPPMTAPEAPNAPSAPPPPPPPAVPEPPTAPTSTPPPPPPPPPPPA